MGWVIVSERELNRVEVLSRVSDGRFSTLEAAALLDVSQRQIQRMMLRYRAGGAGAIRHKARGRRPNNQKSDGVRDYVLSLIRENYADFGPTLATEKLPEKHAVKLSQETVRQWMIAEGLWLKKAARRSFHQPRSRRDAYGELVQIDGSDHHWFEDRAERCTLLVFIDDATSKLMELRFVPSESTFSYFAALERYLGAHGRQRGQGRRGDDPVRAGAVRDEHRDSLREFQLGEGPRRAGEPDASGQAGEGIAG